MGGTSMDEMWDAGFAGSSPPFLSRERTAVDEDDDDVLMAFFFFR